MYKYFDTHAHLDMEQYNKDRETLIQGLLQENIGVTTIGTNKNSSLEAVNLANQYDNVYATIGYHPIDAKEEFEAKDFEELVKNKKVVGVGECGLDFFHLKGNFENEFKKQKDNFEKQINFAVKHNLPLIIHCRDAHKEVIDILNKKKQEFGDRLRGVIHFFSGGIDEAKQYLTLGFYFSFGGVVTFTKDYDEVIKFIPIKRILPETDSPFVAPVPYRGKRNEPKFVKEVYKRIAELKGISQEELEKVLMENICYLFTKIS